MSNKTIDFARNWVWFTFFFQWKRAVV